VVQYNALANGDMKARCKSRNGSTDSEQWQLFY